MPLLNFKSRFASDVRRHRKKCSIRAKRKHSIRKGDILYLYTGLRTKKAEKLGEGVCISIEPVEIFCDNTQYPVIYISGYKMTILELLILAKEEGFNTVFDFLNFFAQEHGFPFYGDLIRWE